MQCPFCRQTLDRKTTWKSTSGKFYCSEFCAEVESMEPAAAGLPPLPQRPQPLRPKTHVGTFRQAAE